MGDWSCHVLTIHDADFLSRCEERRVFREMKVGHRSGASVDEVRRGSFPENSIKGHHTPSKRGKTHPIPGIFWKVSTARRRAFACSFNPSSYTDGGISEKQADAAMESCARIQTYSLPCRKKSMRFAMPSPIPRS
jgi:hypothetical protein